jgi:hypothetical protein
MEDNIHYARGSGTEVEHLQHNPKIEGSYPAVGTGSWKITGKMFFGKVFKKNRNKYCEYPPWARCYKTFYGRNLRIFVIS